MAPVASAVRQATRAPSERPPTTSGKPVSSPARRRSRTAIQAASSWGARGRPAAGNAVRLLDERDGKALRLRGVCRRPEIRRFDSSSSPVAENERRARLWCGTQVGACHPVRRVDLDNRHVSSISWHRYTTPLAPVGRVGIEPTIEPALPGNSRKSVAP